MADKLDTILSITVDERSAEDAIDRLADKAGKVSGPAGSGRGTAAPQANAAAQNAQTSEIVKGLRSLAAGYLASTAISTASTVFGSREGYERMGRGIAAVGGGILGGASAGAIIGPAGIAGGAVIGAVTSSMSFMAEEARRTRDALHDLALAAEKSARSYAVNRQDTAFGRLLETLPRNAALSLVNRRIFDLESGSGPRSIRKLESDLRIETLMGRIDTPGYREAKALLEEQRSRRDSLLTVRDALRLNPVGTPLSAASVTDALGKMGGSVGAQVDIGSVNRDILQVLRDILAEQRRAASAPVDTAEPVTELATARYL